ncbi:FimV/HubP family polar landmark protein [Phytopseudomonas dryadis]|uniref:Peptigoglycan-binding protein LysM n=1 Tax=Phytopseudomonas dryadis TaxID=2487520 RepID=A0A4Q9R0Z1_9GAMM|nr:FimV/HubP family polar landmark protein [Pseudomonas dryadis]TBU90545.1 peptigoglycan-binding protein LysM [Pseudomonas dryadis]
MVRVRKLVLAIAAASALSSGMAHALGMGELTLKSSLNQPLVAEIELLEVRDLSSDELRPMLASPEEFNKAGVDRQYFLTDLTFTPVVNANGRSVIRVTSNKPVREPYLNFLVEVLWPNGRLLREYTLLLDPPLYSPQIAAAAAPQLPVAAPAPPPAAAPAPRPAPQTSASAPSPSPSPSPSAAPAAAGAGGEYRTQANDTLWDIAQGARGNGSVHQAMLAIQDLNPDAFIDGNINRMKAGQVLRLPDQQQVNRRSQSEALAQVSEQNAAWRQSRSAQAGTRQIDATRRTSAGAAPAEVQSQDSLKLLSADGGQSTAGSENGAADSKALSDKLAVTQESLDSTRRENDELKDRMNDLQSQLDKLQRLIQLKDDQLAKLQADLAAPAGTPGSGDPAASAAAPATGSAPAPGTGDTAAPAVPESESAEPGVPAAPEAASPGEADVAGAGDASTTPDAASQAPAPGADGEAAPAPAEAPAAAPAQSDAAAPAVTPAPEPLAETPQDEASALDNLLANPLLLGIIGGSALLALLVLLMIISRRRALKEAELEERLVAEQADDSHRFDADMELPADSLDGLPDDLAGADELPLGEERVTAQTGDALGEADIYIAYGRFNQAADLLHNAINDEPQRADLRLKLMEVYAELGDREGFARQENELREIGGASAEVEQLKSRYPAMAVFAGTGLAAAAAADDLDSFSLDDLTLDEPVQPVAQQPVDNAFDLDLDDLDAEFDRDLQAGQGAAASDVDPLGLDADLEPQAAAQPEANPDDDLGFALDFDDAAETGQQPGGELADFNLDLDAPAAPAAEEDEFLLSLDDEAEQTPADDGLADLSLDLPAPAETPADDDFELPADFDLSLNDEEPAPATEASFAAQLDDVTAELDQLAESLEQQGRAEPEAAPAQAAASDLDEDDDFDFLSGTDETATKLDLARAYIDMGDSEGARDILDEVIAEGNEGQQQEARELIGKLV